MANKLPTPLPAQDPIGQIGESDAQRLLNALERKDLKAVVAALKFYISKAWSEYLTDQGTTVSQGARLINVVGYNDQTAAIATTNLAPSSLVGGLYSLQTLIRQTVASSGTASFQLTVTCTDHGTPIARVFSAVTTNTTTTTQASTFMIYCDAGTPVTFALAYSSTGTPDAAYNLYVRLDFVTSIA